MKETGLVSRRSGRDAVIQAMDSVAYELEPSFDADRQGRPPKSAQARRVSCPAIMLILVRFG